MPECYLLTVVESSSLDKDTNNWSIFSLIENLQFTGKETLPKSGTIGIPIQIHSYWYFNPEEYDNDYEFRFVFEADDGVKSSKKIFPLKSKTQRYRIRIRGFEIFKFGKGKLKVDWRPKSTKKWRRCSIFWPMEIDYAIQTHNEQKDGV